MPDIGPMELIIIAVIVLLVFGPGKAADLGGSLGKGIREFRKATRDDTDASTSGDAPSDASSTATAPGPVSAQRSCTECGQPAGTGRFCTNCGVALDVPA
ncbi:MAG: twin-arginine translocase TatA/TatE family subunit [Chloroflexi bacterium]|nr:twin-arginine translocase TatA/TatE family subunit [Chloroflexota bacterium]